MFLIAKETCNEFSEKERTYRLLRTPCITLRGSWYGGRDSLHDIDTANVTKKAIVSGSSFLIESYVYSKDAFLFLSTCDC
jgi:hypothetical protein